MQWGRQTPGEPYSAIRGGTTCNKSGQYVNQIAHTQKLDWYVSKTPPSSDDTHINGNDFFALSDIQTTRMHDIAMSLWESLVSSASLRRNGCFHLGYNGLIAT